MVTPWKALPPRVRQALQLLLAATALGVAVTAWLYITYSVEGERRPILPTLFFVLPFWYLWALYAPLVIWLSKRYPIERGRVIARSAMHCGIAVVMSFVHTGTRFALQPALRHLPSSEANSLWDILLPLGMLELPVHLFIYWAILGGTILLEYYRRLQEQKLTATRLSAQLADARMQALRMQLNPHFLFNALNSIAMLVRNAEREAAVDTLEALSDLLRYVLDDSTHQEVSLRRELEFVERYLAMEQIRFQNRLEVRTEVEPDVLDAMVPNLVLQPIVENAIRHVVENRASPTTVTVGAGRDGQALRLWIRDDGPGFRGKAGARSSPGVGISNTRRRLAQLYGDTASLDIEDASPSGAIVTINLPLHTVPLAEREER
ncbi:MAG: histidine kinase [Gemmatimonadota bacterium]|nr:MAG: histidine kinase [Gemmatimonadota bacterium]